ncbi:MAG: SDR family oxidoreductase [Chloroflexi bacterium]|nr:SDR family oxidoreductase [Chloroflexota bacterium]
MADVISKSDRLAGKVAIVTGAGSRSEGVGNGKATAVLFARAGASVLLVDNEITHAEETRSIIESEGGVASSFQADVTSEDECKAMVDTAIERYGHLDILDNNVGISLRETVTEIGMDTWDHIMATNLKSVAMTSRFAIPRMIENGGGSIINISSIAGIVSVADPAYSASKAGVIGLTRAMAADHGRDGVRVNCIAPGLVYTPMVEYRLSDEHRARRKNASALGTEGTAWDVGWAAVFLASDESRWVSGVVLPVDAGLTIAARHSYPEWGV